MTPLAFNSLVPQNLRLRFQVAISLLPVAGMLLALIPTYFFAQWLEKLEGIPAQTRLLDHPAGRMWVAVLLIVLVLQLLCGYLLGWLLNALLARWLLRWPGRKNPRHLFAFPSASDLAQTGCGGASGWPGCHHRGRALGA